MDHGAVEPARWAGSGAMEHPPGGHRANVPGVIGGLKAGLVAPDDAG